MDVGSIFQRVKGLAKSVAKMPKDSDYDYEDYDDEIEEEEDDYLAQLEKMEDAGTRETKPFAGAYSQESKATRTEQIQHDFYAQQATPKAQKSGGNIFMMTPPKPQVEKPAAKFRFVYMKVDKIEDTVSIAEEVLSGNTVVLIDMHGVATNKARRIADFLDGVVYACNARMELIADFTYVTVPEGVELSGDFFSQVDTESFKII